MIAYAVILVTVLTVGRFDDRVLAAAGILGLLATLAYPRVRESDRRPLLLFALTPAAAWVASRPPWGVIPEAIIVAGVVGILSGPLDTKRAWLPLGAGIASAAVTGIVASQFGLLPTALHGVGLAILVAAARVVMIQSSPLYGLMAAPIWPGTGGLAVAASEAAFGLFLLTTKERFTYVLGAPFVLVGLL